MAKKLPGRIKANMITGVYFRVEGTAGQENALPWNVLKNLSSRRQHVNFPRFFQNCLTSAWTAGKVNPAFTSLVSSLNRWDVNWGAGRLGMGL